MPAEVFFAEFELITDTISFPDKSRFTGIDGNAVIVFPIFQILRLEMLYRFLNKLSFLAAFPYFSAVILLNVLVISQI